MSLYFNYLAEKTDKQVVEAEFGFVVYSYNPNFVYIDDIYVSPEHRLNGYGSMLLEKVIDEAKAKKINKMMAHVSVRLKNSTESMKAALKHGFKLESSGDGFILLSKELGEI